MFFLQKLRQAGDGVGAQDQYDRASKRARMSLDEQAAYSTGVFCSFFETHFFKKFDMRWLNGKDWKSDQILKKIITDCLNVGFQNITTYKNDGEQRADHVLVVQIRTQRNSIFNQI